MKNQEPQFISLAEAAKMTNYSQDYISLLCRQGKLRAEKLGRNWVTTKDWVYSYVDNTEGKGESVVPVKVKEKKAAEAAPIAPVSTVKTKAKKPFFTYSVLECALFCFASMIWSVNVYAFTTYLQRGDFDFSNDYAATEPLLRNTVPSSAVLASDEEASGSCAADGVAGLETLDAFEMETDANLLSARQADIAAKFGSEIDAVIYKDFAVLNYKSSPEKKFLLMLGE